MKSFGLKASIHAHSQDVKAAVFLSENRIATCSRDSTVKIWDSLSLSPSTEFKTNGFVNALIFVPELNSLFASGADNRIHVYDVASYKETATLIGHTKNVCSLDVQGSTVISGAWDNNAIVWSNSGFSYQQTKVLKGHSAAIWSVKALKNGQFLTASADTTIKLWDNSGKCVRTYKAHREAVRSLVVLSEESFASCSNDATIKLWRFDSEQSTDALESGSSFVYSLSYMAKSNYLLSSGEDRTLKIWDLKSRNVVQTIIHPCVSVWFVDSAGDEIITSGSDGKVYIFTQDESEVNKDDAAAFEKESAELSLTQEAMQGSEKINSEKLPGPEALNQPGTDGKVIMIKRNTTVEAYQRDTASNQWVKIGEVLGSAKRNKNQYAGKDYDYVFDVDVQEGRPPLKLPYNNGENPMEAAQRFILENSLPQGYLQEIIDFIVKNTDSSKTIPSVGKEPSEDLSAFLRILPQKTYLSIAQGNAVPIAKKVLEINKDISQDEQLSEHQIVLFKSLIDDISKKVSISTEMQDVLSRIATWSQIPFAGLDLLRMSAVFTDLSDFKYDGDDLIQFLSRSALNSTNDNTKVMALRVLVNMFELETNRNFIVLRFTEVMDLGSALAKDLNNKGIALAAVTLFLNFCTTANADGDANRAIALFPLVYHLLDSGDKEIAFRALVALGTLLCVGSMSGMAKDQNAGSYIWKIGQNWEDEARFKDVIEEIRRLLL